MAIYIASETHKESEHASRVKEVESFQSPLKDVVFYSSCFKGESHGSFMIIHADSIDKAKNGVPEMLRDSLVEVGEMEWGSSS